MIERNFEDKWFIAKDNSKNKKFAVKATVLVPDPFQGCHNMHFFASVDEIN